MNVAYERLGESFLKAWFKPNNHIGLLRSEFKPHLCMQICCTIYVPVLYFLQP